MSNPWKIQHFEYDADTAEVKLTVDDYFIVKAFMMNWDWHHRAHEPGGPFWKVAQLEAANSAEAGER